MLVNVNKSTSVSNTSTKKSEHSTLSTRVLGIILRLWNRVNHKEEALSFHLNPQKIIFDLPKQHIKGNPQHFKWTKWPKNRFFRSFPFINFFLEFCMHYVSDKTTKNLLGYHWLIRRSCSSKKLHSCCFTEVYNI